MGAWHSAEQFQANVYWCCVLYSLLSMPFAAFNIPAIHTLLIHGDPTGFNANGACVGFIILSQKTEDPEAQTEDDEAVEGSLWFYKWATRIARLAHLGRDSRGGNRVNFEVSDVA